MQLEVPVEKRTLEEPDPFAGNSFANISSMFADCVSWFVASLKFRDREPRTAQCFLVIR